MCKLFSKKLAIGTFFTVILVNSYNANAVYDENDYNKAIVALEDGFYELAEQHIRELILTKDNTFVSTNLALLAHSLWGQGKLNEILIEMPNNPKEGDLKYWIARAYFDLENPNKALSMLEGDQSTGLMASNRLRLKGNILVSLDRLDEAKGVFLRFESLFSNEPVINENSYDIALILQKQNRIDEALDRLLKLELISEGELLNKVQLMIAQLLIDSNVSDAKSRLTKLFNDKKVEKWCRQIAARYLADLEISLGNELAAINVLEKAVPWIVSRVDRLKYKLEICRLYQKIEEWELALKWIEAAQIDVETRTWALRLQMEKAKIFIGQLNFKNAADVFQSVLDVSDQSSQRAWAYYGRGQALLELERTEEAAHLFEQAFNQNEKIDLAPTSLFKAADAYYQSDRFEKSSELYQKFLKNYPDHDYSIRAIYQLGLTNARIGLREEALERFNQVVDKYPQDNLAVESMLRIADVWIAENQWEKALNTYNRLELSASDSEVVLLSKLQRGLLLYALAQYDEAELIFSQIIQSDYESELTLQAIYMRAFSIYMMGNVEDALNLCNTFILDYPESMWTPEVLFWLAEQAFNTGEFIESEKQFLRVYQDYPDHSLSEKALYQAGRSSMRKKMFTAAIDYFSNFVRVYPDSKLLPEIRFSQGDALSELGEYARSILAFEEILKNYPQHKLANAALGRVADCQFALGSDQNERYQIALEGYRSLLERVDINNELRMQSYYKMGRCAEKMSRPDEAFDSYMEAFYSFISESLPRTSQNLIWFTRSGFAAAALQSNIGNSSGAISIYDRMYEAKIPASQEAKSRADKLRNSSKNIEKLLE